MSGGWSAPDLARDLRRMGVREGSTLIVHSSMKSIGRVAGGPSDVVRALTQVVGRRGTILMPAFTYSFEGIYAPSLPFRHRSSPSRTGLITETFRRSSGVLRSRHPTHSVAAWGKKAAEYVEGHERLAAFDAGSPLHSAAMDGALVLLVGCSFSALSLAHVAEAVAEVSYLPVFCWAHLGWRPEALVARAGGAVERVRYAYAPGCSTSFGVLERDAEKLGLLRRARLGDSPTIVFRAREVLELAVARLRARPDYLLCPPGSCRACDEKRAVLEPRSAAARRAVDFMVETMGHAGIRVAGGAGERLAAEIIADRMHDAGLHGVRIEELPIPAWEPGYAALAVAPTARGKWTELPAAPCAHAPSTPERGIVGELAHVESMRDLAKLGRGRGRIAVLWDGYGSSAAELKELMGRGFGGFIFVDRRFSHAERVAVGFPAQWVKHLSAPMLSVPFDEAARRLGRAPAYARISVSGAVRPGTSCNVVGELHGTLPEVIVVSGHHDSTFNSAAADDNLTGVAAMLEIARGLARRAARERRRPLRTIRFCSFGAEELLSEGARFHALGGASRSPVRFVLNNDSMGARVGSTEIHITGSPGLVGWIGKRTGSSTLQFRQVEDVVPFSDHFPFNVAGASSLWFYRTTLATGRHFHHTTHDGLAELDLELVASLARFELSLIEELAFARSWPFDPSLPASVARSVGRTADEWLGSRTYRAPRRGRASG